jgi:choline dehydrogenase-like flavoprotein
MNDKVDVLIIGSGASGAAVAWSLAETKMRILCLEQGDWMKQSDYPTNGRDYEARVFSDYATSPNIRRRPSDYPINDDNSPIKVVNFNAVGGSTVMYTAHYPRLHPSDFCVRTLDGVADDWPIDYPTLEPFFAENDRMTGVSGLAGDPAYPAHEPPMPPLPLGKSGTKIAQTMNQLGWHWWPSDSAIATTARRPAPRARRRAPTSHTGRMPSAPASSSRRTAACARLAPAKTAWRRAWFIMISTASSNSSRRRSSSSPATVSARRGCC